MEYFILNPECYFVKGAVRGAIYDLRQNRVISVGSELAEVLEVTEQMFPIESVLKTGLKKNKVIETLAELAENGLGDFYEQPIIIEKIKPRMTKNQKKKLNILPELQQLYLEINNRCNLQCSFCRQDPNKISKKTGCVTWENGLGINKSLAKEEWEHILKEGKDFGANSVMFVGGDPILVWDVLAYLISKAKEMNYKSITVLTNGTNLDENKILFLKRHEVNILIQIFSNIESTHNKIVGDENAFKNIVKSMILLKLYSVSMSFVVNIVDGCNINDIVDWLNEFSPQNIKIDYIYSSSNLNSEGFRKSMVKDSVKKILPNNFCKNMFFQRCEGHSCWEGKISVCYNGQVTPCPYTRTEIII